MSDATWKTTACGIEVATEGRAVASVRGDKANHRSQGYLY